MEDYPNPADRLLSIEIPENDLEFVKVEVINRAGATVLSDDKMPLKGNKVLIDISGIPAGLYQVVIRTPSSVLNHPVVKAP